MLRQAVFFQEVLATVVALFWQTAKGGKWQVIWSLRRPQIIHDVVSLCIFTMWLFNFFLVKRTLKQELQVKKASGKRDRGEGVVYIQIIRWSKSLSVITEAKDNLRNFWIL